MSVGIARTSTSLSDRRRHRTFRDVDENKVPDINARGFRGLNVVVGAPSRRKARSFGRLFDRKSFTLSQLRSL
ncbi:MAG: hypothetical protein HWQ35_13245 [Nostoc sp. NMS1]|uniref:hypothetical protein n=1 Tax=unclassified Nostoc TaxID=2593658 RepID=UPI0025D3D771|nr:MULTISPECIES: hypothetical protein [unclassified Nostoc]MBN3907483.1 hypothetical protein [Nostoc sp. NMS1]MBN3994478.1 hypothetical protein [Nostoc sp. NMS2]